MTHSIQRVSISLTVFWHSLWQVGIACQYSTSPPKCSHPSAVPLPSPLSLNAAPTQPNPSPHPALPTEDTTGNTSHPTQTPAGRTSHPSGTSTCSCGSKMGVWFLVCRSCWVLLGGWRGSLDGLRIFSFRGCVVVYFVAGYVDRYSYTASFYPTFLTSLWKRNIANAPPIRTPTTQPASSAGSASASKTPTTGTPSPRPAALSN